MLAVTTLFRARPPSAAERWTPPDRISSGRALGIAEALCSNAPTLAALGEDMTLYPGYYVYWPSSCVPGSLPRR